MNFSLWADTDYIQSSNELPKLKCNAAQLRTWCEAMDLAPHDVQLVVKDNKTQKALAVAHYKQGGAVHWKVPKAE